MLIYYSAISALCYIKKKKRGKVIEPLLSLSGFP